MSDTLFDEDRDVTSMTPTGSAGLVRNSKTDMEMQKFSEGVHVDRTYSVRSD